MAKAKWRLQSPEDKLRCRESELQEATEARDKAQENIRRHRELMGVLSDAKETDLKRAIDVIEGLGLS